MNNFGRWEVAVRRSGETLRKLTEVIDDLRSKDFDDAAIKADVEFARCSDELHDAEVALHEAWRKRDL